MSFRSSLQLIIALLAAPGWFSLRGHAQTVNFHHFDTDNGLPSSTVYSVMQDRRGFMWFGTDAGLVKYDGVRFQIFNRQDGLPDNEVLQVQQDKKGRIWLMMFTGGICYLENDKIHNAENDPLVKQFPRPAQGAFMFESSRGVLYFSIVGLGILEVNGSRVKLHSFKQEDQRAAKLIFEDEQGLIWYLGLFDRRVHDRFICISPSRYMEENIINEDINLPAKPGGFYSIPGGFIGLAHPIGFIKYQQGKYTVIAPQREGEKNYTWVTLLKNGDLVYSGLDKGVKWHRQKSDGTLDSNGIAMLENESASCVVEDHEGNLWVSTLRNGVHLQKRTAMELYRKSDDFPLTKVSGCLIDSKGQLWVAGDYSRLIRFPTAEVGPGFEDISLMNAEIYQFEEPVPGYIALAAGFVGLMDRNFKNVAAYLEAERLKMWAKDRTLETVGMISEKVKVLYNVGSVKKFRYDSLRSCIWAATSFGACRFNYNLKSGETSFKMYNKTRAMSVAHTDQGEVYFATMNGMYKIDFDQDTALPFHHENPLMREVFYDIAWHKDWGLIMANASGLFFWTDAGITKLTSADGLASDACKHIWIDEYGHLWISSNGGVSKISNRMGRISIKNFTVADGLLSNEVRSVYTHEARIFVSTSKGLSIFRESDLRKIKTVPPAPFITRLFVEGRDTLLPDTFSLPHTLSNLRFQFAGISYTSIGLMRYKYRLIGFDNRWVETTLPEAWFNYLPPGDYKLEVIAISKNGIASAAPAVVVFTILTPWYQSLAFRIVIIATLISLVWIFFFLRYKARSRREELRRRIMEAEHKALRAQMNPHFIFNSLNSIQKFLAKDDRKEAITYFSRFGRLVRLILDATRNQYISLADEVQTLTLYAQLEQLRTDGKFDFEIHTAGARDLESTRIPPMLIQPYLENAIWHGVMHKEGRGTISVTIRMEGEILVCIVEDNGVGRQKAQELRSASSVRHQSHGTRITEERLALFNENNPDSASVVVTDLYDSLQNPAGTRVNIHLPIVVES